MAAANLEGALEQVARGTKKHERSLVVTDVSRTDLVLGETFSTS